MTLMKLAVLLFVLLLTRDVAPDTPSVLTPYPAAVAPVTFLQGAAVDLSSRPDLPRLFAQMSGEFHINTVNAYGLEPAGADAFFAALAAHDLTAVVRLEAYDPATFAFTARDASRLVARYRPLLERLPAGRVAYLAVNMPADDPRVRARLGDAAADEAGYARTVVDLLRRAAPGIPVFLGLFYGWDGSYPTPSFRDSGADGYVLTSYSYPATRVADASSRLDDLIDTPRLRSAVDRAIADQPGKPIVIEYGFQTLQFQNGLRPDQTAGLVADRAAKQRALWATTLFYRTRYPAVIGTMYFGYDIDKAEGTPPRTLDFGLVPDGRRQD